jgi:hypothetical protein
MQILTLVVCAGLLASGTASAQKIEFNKNYGISGSGTTGQSVHQLPGGNLLIAGTQSQASGGGFQADVLLVKTTPDGTEIWSKTIGVPTLNEYAQMMDVMPDGKVIIGGYFTNAQQPAGATALLICADTSGVVQWQKTYGGSGNFAINAVKAVSDGFIACGVYATPANGDGDAWLLKINKNGDSLWSKTYGGAEYDDSWDMEIAPDGGYVLTGGNYSFADGKYDDAWIIKTDASGNEQWKKMYGLTDRVDWAWAITPGKTNGQITGYAFTGVKDTEEDPPGSDESELHFVKTDLQGNVVWDKSIATPAGSYRREGMDIEQLADGSFVIAAYRMPSTLDARNLHIIKASANGDVLWETTVGTTGEVYMARAVTPTADGGCLITGSYFTPVPAQTVFLVKVGGLTTNIKQLTAVEAGLKIYPNPAQGRVYIAMPANVAILQIEVLDVTGRVLQLHKVEAQHDVALELGQGISGAVMLRVTTADAIITEKILVQ